MSKVLVIVPCGQNKIWDRIPEAGPTAAREAYTGPPFGINRAYAEKFGDEWVILSAKYGIIKPDFQIDAPYNITFKNSRTGPIAPDRLQLQVRENHLERFTTVIGLGGKEYRAAIERAFAGLNVQLHFPFSGLPIGKAMQATKRAVAGNDWLCGKKDHLMSGDPLAATAGQTCHSLHQILAGLPKFAFPFEETQIPRNGIYVLFEDGEAAHGTNRVVRIGTHTGNNQLRSRLKQHFLNEKKDRSIFRKNIGRCLLNRDHDPFLEFWELDLTSRAAKEQYSANIDFNKQNEVEKRVSEYIRGHLRFVVFEVPDKDKRLDLESKLISTISRCGDCGASATWIGQNSPISKIKASGLWQVNELNKMPLSVEELYELQKALGV